MTASVPAVAVQPLTGALAAAGRAVRRGGLLWHPLTAICAMQAVLSLTLVWSNTAFGDEGSYLWVGHLVISHWLHGGPLPHYARYLSGSPVVYPPIGALADSVGGLAGARILSLIFMLGATILLYLTAARLLSRTQALFAAGIWAFSEPAIRLAFATYDPLSVFLTALAAWLAVQAGYRGQGADRQGERVARVPVRRIALVAAAGTALARVPVRRIALIAAAGAALAMANITAYSGIVIDPVVIAFAFLVWLPIMGARRAGYWAGLLAGACAAWFALLMTATGSWVGLTASIIERRAADRRSIPFVVGDIWKYSALLIVLAVIAAVIAAITENRQRAALLVMLGSTIFVIPLAQLHYQTAFSIDKHLAYGIWFAAMAIGYGIGKLIEWVAPARPGLAILCCAAAFLYPAANAWQSAWQVDHGWANARSFVASLRPVMARSHGLIYMPVQVHVAQYYTAQGHEWKRWAGPGSMQLDPALPRHDWGTYYAARLRTQKFGVIVLLYRTTLSSVTLPGDMLLSPDRPHISQALLGLVGVNSGEPGLPDLTQALQRDPAYRLVAVGPYDSGVGYIGYSHGLYAIWQRVGP
jgi:hypothetical protein